MGTRETRTVLFTDLVFYVTDVHYRRARLFYALVGGRELFGPHRIVRWAIRDKRAARRSIDRILEWDFDRVTVAQRHDSRSSGEVSNREEDTT